MSKNRTGNSIGPEKPLESLRKVTLCSPANQAFVTLIL